MAETRTKGEGAVSYNPRPEIGVPGFRESSGIIYEEFLPPLRWPRATQTYKEMSMNDPIIAGILFAMEMIIRKVTWTAKSNGDDSGKEFLESCMHDMTKSWSETINDILSFLTYGYSVHEIVYKKRLGPKSALKFKSKYNDSLWGWSRLPTRAQDTIVRWKFEGDSADTTMGRMSGDTTDVIGVVQRIPNSFAVGDVFIPRNKFLLFRNNTKKDNPESTSILRGAYRSWFFKKTIEEIEAIGIERNLQGIPIAKIPQQYLDNNADDDQKAVKLAILDILANMKANKQAGILWPLAYDEMGNELFKFEILNGGGGNSKVMDTTTVIQRYNSNIAQSVLADFILLGQQSVGSFALSSNKTQLFHAAISSWLDSIASVFNKEAIPALWKMNGWEQDDTMPELTYGNIDQHSIEQLGEYFKSVAESGLIQPTEELQEFILERVSAPSGVGTELKTVDQKMNSETLASQEAIAAQTAVDKEVPSKDM